MSCRDGAIAAFPVLLVLPFFSCSRQPKAAFQSLAIVRFENLGTDPQTDWMGRAFSDVIGTELASVPDIYAIGSARIRALDRTLGARPISAPGISAEQPGAVAAGAARIGYGTYWIANGRLEARLRVVDSATNKDVQVLSASTAQDDLLRAAHALARQISPRAGSYITSNPEAVKDYARAVESSDASTIEANASRAIAADPNFGPAYGLLAQLKAQQDRQGAIALLEQALSRSGMPAAEHARLAIEAAGLKGDAAALEKALADLAKAEPGDLDTWKLLGQTAYNRHDYGPAKDALERVLKAEPNDVASLNQLAYAAAYRHDLAGATSALRRYASLRPKDANPLDSLGDVNLIAGHLNEAVDFYVQAANKDPKFYGGADWFKAAVARLMAGDVAAADKLAGQYANARTAAHDPSVPILNAAWQWLSGRRKTGYSALSQFARSAEAGSSRELASRAYSQLAVWSLLTGDRPPAEQAAAKAAALAGPTTGAEAAIVRFLTQPPAPAAEWQKRAEQLAPNPAQQAVRDSMLSYALLLSREFAPAADVLQRLYETESAISSESLPVLLAWAYLETGRESDAARLLEFNPVPPIGGPGVFTALYFPRLFELRARLAEKQGRPDAAQADAKLFATLSADR